MFTEETMIHGEIYVCNSSQSSNSYIRRKGGSHIYRAYEENPGWMSKYSWGHSKCSIGLNIRKATLEEKQWLIACEKAKEFVPKPKNIKPIYRVY